MNENNDIDHKTENMIDKDKIEEKHIDKEISIENKVEKESKENIENIEKTEVKDEQKNSPKKKDLKSLLAASDKKKPKTSNSQKNQNINKSEKHIKTTNSSDKKLINIDSKNLQATASNKNNETIDGWEEVKKGGSRMKLGNTENSFDISSIGKIFQGVLKHDLETKGLSISKCLIEPFFVLSLDLAEGSLANCFDKFFSRKKVENISNPEKSFHQRAFIEKLPKILIIHVKGFYYDKVAHKVVKINKELEYPFDLKIKKEYFSPSAFHHYKENEYELISSN